MQAYKVKLQTHDLALSTVNQRLSAIRKLARETADNGLVDQILANGIKTVKGVKSVGRGRPASPRGVSSGAFTKADTSVATGWGAQVVADVVREYAGRCGFGSPPKTSTS